MIKAKEIELNRKKRFTFLRFPNESKKKSIEGNSMKNKIDNNRKLLHESLYSVFIFSHFCWGGNA